MKSEILKLRSYSGMDANWSVNFNWVHNNQYKMQLTNEDKIITPKQASKLNYIFPFSKNDRRCWPFEWNHMYESATL